MCIFSREEFINFAKSSGVVKEYLERSGRGSSSRPAPVQAAAQVRSMDKASAAFRAIDKDNSGYVDREEFLQFTRSFGKLVYCCYKFVAIHFTAIYPNISKKNCLRK